MVARNLVRIAAALAATAAMLWLAGAPAAAAANPVVLTPMPTVAQEGGKAVTIAARLTDGSTNRALGSLDVQFYVMTDVFGPRLMSVGHALTDTTGRAAVSYKPSWEGDTKVVARFTGNAQYSPAETTFQFVAAGPVPVHENAKFGLEPIRAWAPAIVMILVVLVWAVLAGVVIHTIIGLRSPAPASAGVAIPAQMQPASEDFGDGAS